uniref:long-chain-fatty-acid--CoA ligase n=2 Tax=Jaculus jaculus TaxID=51337 RepID=A0A8C5L8N4_JACJA
TGYWTTKMDGEVQLRLQNNSQENEAPCTVHDMIMDTATKFTHYTALGSKYKKGWHLLSYIEYYELCRRAAKAFLKVGLERFHVVGIMGFNSEEWAIANIGAIMAGGITVGILTTTSSKACQVLAENLEMDVFVVDNDRQLQKLIQIQGYLKHLKAIIQYKEEIQEMRPNLYSWKEFLDLADDITDERLDQVIDSQKPNQCCTLMFNIEASGIPKVMMLSHDNITWTTAAIVQSLSYKYPPEGQEVIVSYLPLNHMGPQIFDIWVTIYVAGTLYFPPSDVGKTSGIMQAPGTGFLMDMLREVQPTTFYGIPWVWDHMLDNLKASHLDSTAFRRKVHKWAMQLGLKANKKRMLGLTHLPLCFGMAKMLTFDPARKFLGLSKCEQFFNMGQGLPASILDFFLSLDITIFEVYGLTQCTGIHCLSSQQAFRLLSSGKSLPNTRTNVEEENKEGIGNISIWGRNVFMGYLHDKESSSKMIDNQGWLHTEDLGFLDNDNFLYVVGTSKDIITLSSGETVNPCPIEERVKILIPIVRYAMVVGQGAPYLCILLTIKCQINMDTGEPRGTLTSEATAFCRTLHSSATRLVDVLDGRDHVITEFINKAIEAANSEVSSETEKIVKWIILDNDFSVNNGELGAMTRMRRTVVAKMYQEEIQKLYE